MPTTINADTSTGGAVVTGDASGVLALQAAGNTALTLNSSRAVGVGAGASFGSSGQLLTSQGSASAPVWSSTITTPVFVGSRETQVAIAASAIDLSLGNWFTKTITTTTTFTVSNVPSSGTAASFILNLTNGGSNTINWWSGMTWAGGTAPTLTSAGRDVLGFFTYDGGTTWSGLVLGKDVK